VTFEGTMEDIAKCFEAAGVTVLVVGGLIAFARAVDLVRDRRVGVYSNLRSFFGRTILLGLEILVAADLIRTVAIDPSLENVAVLGIIVVIRTFLSFSLDVEIEGRWPWSRARSRAVEAPS